MTFLDELARELGAVGIRGRLRRRILLEAEDHLRSGGTPDRFGDPREVANAFAAELGTQAAARSALLAFGALAVAGAAYAAAFLAFRANGQQFLPRAHGPLELLAAAAIVLGPQLALVAGGLGFLRALRRRRERVLPSAELAVLHRRTALALASALAAMGGFLLYAAVAGGPQWRTLLVFVACGGSALLLAAASVPLVASARLRPRVAGAAGDVFDDLPLPRTEPWRLARRVAVALFVVVTVAGVVRSDPFDGAIRGAIEALALLLCFRLLGRFLGLRR